MKQRFTHAIYHIVETNPVTTYDNFARDFGERFLAGYKASPLVDPLFKVPFDE